MDILEIAKEINSLLKASDEQHRRDWLNKINSRPRKKKNKK